MRQYIKKARMRCVGTVVPIVLFIGIAVQLLAEDGVESQLPARILGLDEAHRLALENNPSYGAAVARIKQARERVAQSRSAYLPQVDISASAARVTLSDRDYQAGLSAAQAFNPGASIPDPENYYSARLLVGWVLFNGFGRHHTHEAARFGQQVSEASRQDAKRLLLSAVSSAYYAAQLAAESIQIAEADEKFNLRQLAEARARRRVGTGSLSDVLNFEVRANEAKAQVIQAKSVYDRTIFGLAALLGDLDILGPLESVKLAPLSTETEDEMAVPVATELISYARQHRPDIRQAVLEGKQAEANVGIARAKFYPALALSASIDGDSTGELEIEADDLGNTIALSLSYPLFTGGLNRSMLREAEAKLEEADKRCAGLETDMQAQIMRAVAGVTSGQEQLRIQRRNAALVQRNRDLVEKEYMAGQGSLVRLNQAQRDLTNAQGRLALALVSLRQAWHDLRTETAHILSDD